MAANASWFCLHNLRVFALGDKKYFAPCVSVLAPSLLSLVILCEYLNEEAFLSCTPNYSLISLTSRQSPLGCYSSVSKSLDVCCIREPGDPQDAQYSFTFTVVRSSSKGVHVTASAASLSLIPASKKCLPSSRNHTVGRGLNLGRLGSFPPALLRRSCSYSAKLPSYHTCHVGKIEVNIRRKRMQDKLCGKHVPTCEGSLRWHETLWVMNAQL